MEIEMDLIELSEVGTNGDYWGHLMFSNDEFKPMYDLIPKKNCSEITLYVKFGYTPSPYVIAILENDFTKAKQIGYEGSLCDWASFLVHCMPRESFGSPEKVNLWIEKGGLIGRKR